MQFPPCLQASILAVFFLALGGCARQPVSVSGKLSGELFWRGTVQVHGDVIVAEGAHLRIAPGTKILFTSPAAGEDSLTEHPNFPGSELIVRGTLLAEGEATAPIIFRHSDADAPAGSWGGINLQQSANAVFRHCLFTQADSAVHSQESTVRIEQSVFRDNLVGIRFHSSAIRIENNLLTGNGTAIRFHFGAPLIRGNRIQENDKGIFITSYPNDYRIEGNDFIDNHYFNIVLGEEVTENLPMLANWWGDSDPAVIEGGFFDGRREPYLGQVLYAPAANGPVAAEAAPCSR
jgi:hypothetical protein